MALKKQGQKLLRKLAVQVAKQPGPLEDGEGFFYKFGQIPESVSKPGEDVHQLFLTKDEWIAYSDALDALVAEPELEHVARNDIDRDLWEMVCDLAINWRGFQSSGNLGRRIAKFTQQALRPHQDYEVVFTIDDLQLSGCTLRFGRVVFTRMEDEQAWDWCQSDHPLHAELLSDIRGSTVAIARVRAGSPTKAVERAVIQIDSALDYLRLAVGSYRSWTIWDFQLLQRRGSRYAVRELAQLRQLASVGGQRGFRPVPLNLTDEVLGAVVEFSEHLQPVFDGGVPTRLQAPLLRAAEWIGTSVTRENFDDKVTDLCTALECLLTTRDDGRKGESIALRSMLLARLLQRPFAQPGQVLRLYELRSLVVHGSDLRVCTERDYRTLRRIAEATLTNVADLLSDHSEIDRMSRLIAVLEEDGNVQSATTLLGESEDRDTRRVLTYVERRSVGASKIRRIWRIVQQCSREIASIARESGGAA